MDYSMNYYITTEEEERLLQLEYDTSRLSLREKKTISRLQIVSYKGVKALKSIEDRYQKLRIVIATVLTKIFFSFNSDNQNRLYKLKDILYSSSLKPIIEQRGIDRNHLLKSAAQALRSMKVCLDSEAQVIRLFNTVPFFDQVIMKAFAEYKTGLISKDQVIRDWLREDLGMEVDWEGHMDVINQKGNQISLIGLMDSVTDIGSPTKSHKGFCEYMRYSSQDIAFNDEQNDQPRSNNLISYPQTPEERSNNRKEENHDYILMSIESGSPTIKKLDESRSQRKKVLKEEKSNMKEFGPIKYDMKKDKGLKTSEFSSRDSDRVVKMRRKKEGPEQVSGVWSFLCCSFANER